MSIRTALALGLFLGWFDGQLWAEEAAAPPTSTVATAVDAQGAVLPLYSLPYAPGAEFLVGGGYLEWPTHEGVYALDWQMPEETPIMAACAGVVVETVSSHWQSGLSEELRNKDNHVIIRHDDGTYAYYAHLAQHGVQVRVGQRVREGEPIALSGNTGYSSTPHLHFVAYRMRGNTMQSFPTLFKSGQEAPFAVVSGGKYRAPGGTPEPEEGPLAGVQGTGQLSFIRPELVSLVRAAATPQQGAMALKRHLLDNRKKFKTAYKDVMAKSRGGDKSAMKELELFLNAIDLQSQPEIATLLVDKTAEPTTREALQVWWELYAP